MYHTNSTNAKKPLISTGFYFRVPVPRGLTLNEQDINYKHTAQHTDKHTENTKTNGTWEKDDNNFYTNGHDYNDKHTENTTTNGLWKKDDNNFLYKWTRLQLHAHGKY